MAKKRVVGVSTAEKIGQLLAKEDFVAAVAQAKKLHDMAPTPDALALFRKAVTAAAERHVARGRTKELGFLLLDADRVPLTAPDWLGQLAKWHIAAGNIPRATALAEQSGDATLKAKLIGHVADAAIRAKSNATLSPELHAGYEAVMEAFKKYHLGHDNAARDRLNEIGLASPFLEWKLLLRGLIAFTASDDATAKENWARLNADRLPAKLAAPLRSKVDPAAPAAGPDPLRAFSADTLAGKLRKVQAEFGKGRGLAAPFKSLDALLPTLKAKLPAAVPKLANVMYHAIGRQGQPDDLERYRKTFGAPADDPFFHKLQGRVLEDIGELRQSLQHWALFEGWLSTLPSGWPEPLARRARAMIQHRMADIALDLGDDEGSPFDDVFSFLGAKRGRQAKTPPPDATVYLKKAIELAPDWEAPAAELFTVYLEEGRTAEAEAVARAFLAKSPNSLPMLTGLSMLLAKAGRAADALDLRRKALATNPLDHGNRVLTAFAVVAAARRLAIDGKPAEAEQLLTAEAALCDAEAPAGTKSLRAVLARKAGRKDEANALTDSAVAVPGGRLSARLLIHATSVLLKLKPADKTAASKALTAALAETPTPMEANQLYAAWDALFLEGLTYTGQKTQEKKIHDVMLSAADGTGSELDFERLCAVIDVRQEWKLLAKVTEKLRKRFKANPAFTVFAVTAELNKTGPRVREYKLADWLHAARKHAEASTEERHRQLVPKIDDLIKQTDPFAALGNFFG